MCGCAEVNKTLPYYILLYIEETHYSERMIANMSKASALVDVSKKRVNPFKELWTNKFLYLLALPAVVYTVNF